MPPVPAGRPLGFLRSMGALRRRAGVLGTVELLAPPAERWTHHLGWAA
jgi:hypothetical protein